MKFLSIMAVVLLSSSLAMAQSSRTQQRMQQQTTKAIESVIEAQRGAWNKGDIEGYMDGYERSENIVFVSGDNVTHGWQTVHDRYKKGYDTREKMGELTFSNLETTLLGPDYAFVVGKWSLKRAQDQPHGRFTLIFHKTKVGWRIVHDHTTSLT
jgi:ketosteroid isomerase-like protein